MTLSTKQLIASVTSEKGPQMETLVQRVSLKEQKH